MADSTHRRTGLSQMVESSTRGMDYRQRGFLYLGVECVPDPQAGGTGQANRGTRTCQQRVPPSKTTPHQLWATDASYFRVAGWGYYYMVTVMDDFSRFILAWRLQFDMTSASLIEVVQDAVDLTGMTDVPGEDWTRLLSGNGPGYVSRLSREYLQLVGIRHVLAAPYHPQTNGKLERYHQTLKRDVNQLPYDVPRELEVAIGRFVDFYNYHRYHKALRDITPAAMLAGRREEILGRRGEVKDRTINKRKLSNQALREQLRPV